ncbi:hypothetical protein H5O84_001062, partial [Campylobacter jejuni]|nr:hypothetical protein [Campylobacter jejuni]
MLPSFKADFEVAIKWEKERECQEAINDKIEPYYNIEIEKAKDENYLYDYLCNSWLENPLYFIFQDEECTILNNKIEEQKIALCDFLLNNDILFNSFKIFNKLSPRERVKERENIIHNLSHFVKFSMEKFLYNTIFKSEIKKTSTQIKKDNKILVKALKILDENLKDENILKNTKIVQYHFYKFCNACRKIPAAEELKNYIFTNRLLSRNIKEYINFYIKLAINKNILFSIDFNNNKNYINACNNNFDDFMFKMQEKYKLNKREVK